MRKKVFVALLVLTLALMMTGGPTTMADDPGPLHPCPNPDCSGGGGGGGGQQCGWWYVCSGNTCAWIYECR